MFIDYYSGVYVNNGYLYFIINNCRISRYIYYDDNGRPYVNYCNDSYYLSEGLLARRENI